MKRAICENGGCLSKLPGNELVSLLKNAQRIVGEVTKKSDFLHQFDDCAVVECGSETLLLTTDQSPPVGHDPYIAGKIAALHAISDIYAMGGLPLYALASIILGKNTTAEEGEQFLAGLYEACMNEDVQIVGGHTIRSVEPIIGLSVIGTPQIVKPIVKRNCLIGDCILVSKPIGTGMILRGYYNGLLDDNDYDNAINVMTQSNKVALEIASNCALHALTDITGFGLLGHLSEMLSDGQGACLDISKVPYLSGIHMLPYIQMKTSYIEANIAYLRQSKKFRAMIDSPEKMVLFDPQTNGSLLVVVDRNCVKEFMSHGFSYIGEIIESDEVLLGEVTL